MRHLLFAAGATLIVAATGCVHVSTDPIEIKPVRIDIYQHVDKQLDDFFDYQNNAAPAPAPAPSPSTQNK